MSTTGRKAAVLGAGGFAGAELLRLVVTHPELRLSVAVSESNAGRAVGEVYSHMAPWTDLSFRPISDWRTQDLDEGAWTVFAALDHRESMELLPSLIEETKGKDVDVIDLSGAFRLRDTALYEAYYGFPHTAADQLTTFIYGLPELHRHAIRRARWIANPGCFATCSILALLPAAAAPWAIRCVALDGMTGSSGAGAQLRRTTHHPRRANNLEAYRPLQHQHLPEIVQAWTAVGGNAETPISFVPHRAPMVRGIYVSAHLFLESPVQQEEAFEWYRSYYKDEPFVRVISSPPSVVDVWGSNRCDISVTVGERCMVVNAALDNLVKGAAGQALQNTNLMNGWDETAGLLVPMPTPA